MCESVYSGGVKEGRDGPDGWKWAVNSGEISDSQMNALIPDGISTQSKIYC